MTAKKQITIAMVALIFTPLFLLGCDDKDKKTAYAQANQAKAELVKLKAELLGLKAEKAFLKEKLQTATLAHEQVANQLNDLLEEHDELAGEAEDAQQSSEHLITILAEQVKEVTVLQEQNDQLKAVIEQLQATIKQQQEKIDQQLTAIEALQAQPAPETIAEEQEPNELPEQL